MADYTADPDCALCDGSGIDPNSMPTYHDGAPGIADWSGADPCPCILGQWPDDQITGYPDHYIVNGDHSWCSCGDKDVNG